MSVKSVTAEKREVEYYPRFFAALAVVFAFTAAYDMGATVAKTDPFAASLAILFVLTSIFSAIYAAHDSIMLKLKAEN